jgi:6-phosphogluconolactonase
LAERKRLIAAATAEYKDRPTQRVTLTLTAINSARQVLFLVSGGAKAAIVQSALEGTGQDLPARQVQPVAGRLTWLLDAEAARLIAT